MGLAAEAQLYAADTDLYSDLQGHICPSVGVVGVDVAFPVEALSVHATKAAVRLHTHTHVSRQDQIDTSHAAVDAGL